MNPDDRRGAPPVPYVPGDVLVLLTDMPEGLRAGFYVVSSIMGDWIVLRYVIDDEKAEQLRITQHETGLPAAALSLFMPVGIRLAEAV